VRADGAEQLGGLGGVNGSFVGVFRNAERVCAFDEAEDLADAGVEVFGEEFATVEGLADLLAAGIGRTRHFEVKAGLDGFDSRVGAKPVRHDETFKAPLIAEDMLEDLRVLADVRAIEAVVGGHVAPGFRVTLSNLEWHQVDLSQSTFGHDCKVLVIATYELR
jgi:hypothetical protein